MALPKQSKMAEVVASSLESIGVCFNEVTENWYFYDNNHWIKSTKRGVKRLINTEVKKAINDDDEGYSDGYLNGITNFVEMLLSKNEWNNAVKNGHIPFNNGLLDIGSKTLIRHRKNHLTTWVIPYDYDKQATAQPIIDWLNECVNGQQDQVQLLRAYMNAILVGRPDLQRYLELIGPGGSGKGTFIRLCELLVGNENCYSTELKHLENNRFETANLHGKRLTTITDTQNYAGDVSVLKAITGQDSLRYEEKKKQGGLGFKYEGRVIIAANEAIASKDYTSGIARRRITVEFKNVKPSNKRRDLIEEFKPLVAGLINWVLDMTQEEVTAYIRDTSEKVPSLRDSERQNLVATNPIAQWLDECVIVDEDAKTSIGNIKRDGQSILESDKKLYPSYVEFCESTGTKPLATNRFVNLLDELCNVQLGLKVSRERDRNGRYFKGLRVKAAGEAESQAVTGVTGVTGQNVTGVTGEETSTTTSKSTDCKTSVTGVTGVTGEIKVFLRDVASTETKDIIDLTKIIDRHREHLPQRIYDEINHVILDEAINGKDAKEIAKLIGDVVIWQQ